MERKRPEDYHLKSKGIIYANVGDVSAEDLERLMQKKENAKGLILDMRRYPRGYTRALPVSQTYTLYVVFYEFKEVSG